MTEQEWLRLDRPQQILKALPPGRQSQRKLRLFGCACVRRVWDIITDKRGRHAVETTERFVDGLTNQQALAMAAGKANWAVQYAVGVAPQSALRAASLIAGPVLSNHDIRSLIETAVGCARCAEDDAELACQAQAAFLRCVIGNRFRPVSIDPAWLTPSVLFMSQAAYENRNLPSGTLENTRLAAIADALEEAGCHDADILNHCRHPGVHVRGCWVLDLLLGKE